MPTIPFVTTSSTTGFQISPVPQASQSVRLHNTVLSATADLGDPAGFCYLAALSPTPQLPYALPFRSNFPMAWAGDISLPPGSPLCWRHSAAATVYGHAGYTIDGPNIQPLGPWTPLNLGALGSWLSPAGTQWSDNRATAVTATDARVHKWAADVRSFDGTAADTGANRLYRTAEGGVRGDGTAATFRLFNVLTAGDFTIACKVRRVGAGASGYFGPSWSANARFSYDGAGNFNYFDDAAGYGAVNIIPGVVLNQWYALALKREAGVLYLRGSGGPWITYGPYSPQLTGVILSPVGGLMTADAQVLEAVFMFKGMTDAEWTALNTYWGT